jgi:SAM-dependent methyltransferase
MERIYLTKEEINETLQTIRFQNHIERYQLVKRYLYGTVLDVACGIGYGTYLMSNVPDVDLVIGADIDEQTIRTAGKNFKASKTQFLVESLEEINLMNKIDCVVSLETIEHLKDLNVYKEFIHRHYPELIVLSYPNKKSTHFNKYHYQDLNKQDIINLLPEYHIVKSEKQQYDVTILVMVKNPPKMPSHIFSNFD